jgi:hypothetical protein
MRIFSCVLLHAYSPCVRDKPAVVLRMGVPHREGLDTHAGLESCVTILPNSDTFSFRLLEGVCVNATASSRLPAVSRRHRVTKIKRFACVSNQYRTWQGSPEWFWIAASQMLCVPCSAATVRYRLFSMHPTAICQVSEEIRESHHRLEKGKHRRHRNKMRTTRQISRSKE